MSNDEPPSNSPADVGHAAAAPTVPQPLKYSIPMGTPGRDCKSCKARIFWILTAKNRWMPVNADGTSHFGTCPNADAHRSPR